MEVVMNEEDKAFSEAVLEVQLQVLLWKERTSRKFQKLEELTELAAQKLSLLMNIKAKQQEEGFVDAFGWKAKVMQDSSGQQPSVIEDSVCHLELRLPKFEGAAESSECLKDGEHQLADFGKGNMIQEWPNSALVAWEAYTGEPIYDEEQGEGQDCWPEQEFILAALNRSNLDATKPLQSEICRSESDRSEELEDVSNMLNLLQKNVSPGDTNIDTYNVTLLSKKEKYLEISAMDPYIFHSITSSTTNCMTAPGNSLTWSAEDVDMPTVGNNSNGKFELNGHSPFFNEKGIYSGLENSARLRNTEFGISTKDEEAAYDMNLVFITERAPYLELKDLYTPLRCASKVGELDWIQVDSRYAAHSSDMKLWFTEVVHGHGDVPKIVVTYKWEKNQPVVEKLTMILTNMKETEIVEAFPCNIIPKDSSSAANCYGFGKKPSNFGENIVLIFDPGGGHVQNTNSKGVTKMIIEKFRHKVTLDDVACDQIGQLQDQDIQKVCEKAGIFDKIISEINEPYVDSLRAGMVVIPYRYTVLRPGNPVKVMRLEVEEAWRRKYTITIFDPGGKMAFSDIQVEGSGKCKINHEDMVIFKGEGLLGTAYY